MTDWQQEARGLFLWPRNRGMCHWALAATAASDGPELEAFPASTIEALVLWDRQMTALATDETPVRKGRHRLELVARHAVRAPNYRRIHRDIHDLDLLCPRVPPP